MIATACMYFNLQGPAALAQLSEKKTVSFLNDAPACVAQVAFRERSDGQGHLSVPGVKGAPSSIVYKVGHA